MPQTTFTLRGRNPDVLTCIANLSNDEVFTPPELANQMLDALADAWAACNKGADIWQNRDVTFLDPCAKTGVFLREITRRLTKGLESTIPNIEDRVNHILTKQVYGIGITRITSLLARRSLYCSKHANGKHSIAKHFTRDEGNIWYERLEHSWTGERCSFCGASRAIFDRGKQLDTHAYSFIHTDGVKETLNRYFGGEMNFDVVIGNPPYQMSTGGAGGAGVQARPIYNLFIDQAKLLEPRFLCMVTPSRWFSGGMGLDSFRESMLSDDRLRVIHDYPDSNDVFPGTQIKGGISYFLWDRDNRGEATVTTHDKGKVLSSAIRPLLESGSAVFIRYNEGIPILRKVLAVEVDSRSDDLAIPVTKQFMQLVSSIGAFGLDTTFKGKDKRDRNDVLVYRNGGVGYINRRELVKSVDAIDWWKIFIPRAGSGSDSFPHPILGKPFIGEPGTASSWTYMHIGPFRNKEEAEHALSYITTRFFRFLVLLHKATQDATSAVYTFVPMQDFSRKWTDQMLYQKYELQGPEIDFIERMVRPMILDESIDNE